MTGPTALTDGLSSRGNGSTWWDTGGEKSPLIVCPTEKNPKAQELANAWDSRNRVVSFGFAFRGTLIKQRERASDLGMPLSR